MSKYLAKLRPALGVLGIVLSLVVGYNTWAQIDQANPPAAAEDTAL